jgi:hypothetical protein
VKRGQTGRPVPSCGTSYLDPALGAGAGAGACSLAELAASFEAGAVLMPDAGTGAFCSDAETGLVAGADSAANPCSVMLVQGGPPSIMVAL